MSSDSSHINCDNGYNQFSSVIIKPFEAKCPVVNVIIPQHQVLKEPWMTNALRLKSQQLQRQFRKVSRLDRTSELFQPYIEGRNAFRKEKRQAKTKYVSDYLIKYKADARKLWGLIKENTGGGGSKQNRQSLLTKGGG